MFAPGEKGKGTLHINIHQAKELPRMDPNGLTDGLVKCHLLPDKSAKGKRKTNVVKNNPNPVWEERFTYEKVTLEELSKERVLEACVCHNDPKGNNVVIGGVRLGSAPSGTTSKHKEWMDSIGEEVSHWEAMLTHPGEWVDRWHTLRHTMEPRSVDLSIPPSGSIPSLQQPSHKEVEVTTRVEVQSTKMEVTTPPASLQASPSIQEVIAKELPSVKSLASQTSGEKVDAMDKPAVDVRVETHHSSKPSVEVISQPPASEQIKPVPSTKEISPSIQLKTDPSPKVTTEIKVEQTPKVTTELKTEPTPKVTVQLKTEPSPKVTAEVKTDPSPKVTTEVKVEQTPKVTTELKTEPTPKVTVQLKTEPSPKVTAEVKTDPSPKVTTEVKVEQTPKVTTEVKTEPTPEVTTDVKTEPLKETSSIQVKVEPSSKVISPSVQLKAEPSSKVTVQVQPEPSLKVTSQPALPTEPEFKRVSTYIQAEMEVHDALLFTHKHTHTHTRACMYVVLQVW